MQSFKLAENISIICQSENTRYGFRHLAYLMINGYEKAKDKACYYNRTWESFEYETVAKRVISKYFEGNERKKYLDMLTWENLRNLR